MRFVRYYDEFKMKYRATEVRIVSASLCPAFRLATSIPKYLSLPPKFQPASANPPPRPRWSLDTSALSFSMQVTGGCMEGGLAGVSGVAAPDGAGRGGDGGGAADKERPSRGSAKRGRDGSKPGKAGN